MTIACVGITVLDRIQQVESLPSGGGKYIAKDYFEVGGGPAATAAVAVAKLGHAVDFIGRVGQDSVAETLLTELNKYGVNTDKTIHIDAASSAFSVILVDNQGERIIVNYQDPSLSRDPSPLKNIDFSRYTTILTDVRWPEGTEYALQQAKNYGIPSVLDADMSPDPIDSLVKLADHVAFSEPGLEKFTGCADPIEGLKIAQKQTSGKVYVTVGSQGCYWLENQDVCHEPVIKVNVVDTTGAGDVFHGALAVAVAEAKQSRESIVFSNTVAALKCTKRGGREGIPTRVEVDQKLQK
ncbi:PfkB family carbohydrate kinase [Vibrio gazogenes]|uniref:Sulfofructose kinase n=1 Tax=Vibrio gazogenes DSM 21264 = NBRC 103151 TaxID=1123492 RepID=A0A1M5BX03_VIBGA|nr:PfkB family carbohydrate kinase [Vibrio gazogenes]USP13623.1 PfkB family carbohydrate kinase [Vibrio gazogenes]SHF46837.1 sulfofructose kinase [Vibrio gazogenes DSM 21264] [Vibrio gazogenes DSM 21264 = NBRC 103151]SJN55665.1 Ribokinase [Vibrio gazogenes]